MASSSNQNSPSKFMVGQIEVPTMVEIATISPSQTTPSSPRSTQSPPKSPSPLSPVSSPSPPKKKSKKTKKPDVVLSPKPIQMVPLQSSKSPKPSSTIAGKKKTTVHPLQKDTSYPTVFAPSEIALHKHTNFGDKVVPADIKLAPNNFLAVDTIPDENINDYADVFNFLWYSPVANALKVNTSRHYHHLLQEFWWTAEYDESTRCIEGSVLRGQKVVSIDVDIVRRVLQLEYKRADELYVAAATSEDWRAILTECGYGFNIQDESKRGVPNNPLKAHLPGVYHYLLTNIITSLVGILAPSTKPINTEHKYFMGL